MSEFAFLADQDHALSLISETSFAVQVVQEARHFFSRDRPGNSLTINLKALPNLSSFAILVTLEEQAPASSYPLAKNRQK